MPNGNLQQGYYSNDKMEDLHIINFKATGDTAVVEYKNDLIEGLFAFHKSDGIIWSTYSKDQEHGLKILQNNDVILMEAGKFRKEFSQREIQQIIQGTLDVKKFFKK